jgi:hypothetical protein
MATRPPSSPGPFTYAALARAWSVEDAKKRAFRSASKSPNVPRSQEVDEFPSLSSTRLNVARALVFDTQPSPTVALASASRPTVASATTKSSKSKRVTVSKEKKKGNTKQFNNAKQTPTTSQESTEAKPKRLHFIKGSGVALYDVIEALGCKKPSRNFMKWGKTDSRFKDNFSNDEHRQEITSSLKIYQA